MTRFFASQEEMSGERILLTGENAQHAKVLRLKPGETVLVLADEKRGLAIPAKAESQRLMGQIFSELEGK